MIKPPNWTGLSIWVMLKSSRYLWPWRNNKSWIKQQLRNNGIKPRASKMMALLTTNMIRVLFSLRVTCGMICMTWSTRQRSLIKIANLSMSMAKRFKLANSWIFTMRIWWLLTLTKMTLTLITVWVLLHLIRNWKKSGWGSKLATYWWINGNDLVLAEAINHQIHENKLILR